LNIILSHSVTYCSDWITFRFEGKCCLLPKVQMKFVLVSQSISKTLTRIIEVMDAAGIKDGPRKCPKGLRHGFGIKAVTDGVPFNMMTKWTGHAKLETTEIYTNAVGEQKHDIAARMWRYALRKRFQCGSFEPT
jgi:site-specific recombinase XerD